MGAATERAEVALRAMISSGRFTAGERLPTESDLAQELGVSKGTLRSAIAALAGAGAVKVRQGDGTYVSDLDAQSLLSPLASAFPLLNDNAVAELNQLRTLLEPAALARAMQHFSDSTDEGLTALVEQMESSHSDAVRYMQLDDEFHAALIAPLANSTVSYVLQLVVTQSRPARLWRADTDPSALVTSDLDHRTILVAAIERDAEAARAALHLHLRDGERWLRLALQHAPNSRMGSSYQ